MFDMQCKMDLLPNTCLHIQITLKQAYTNCKHFYAINIHQSVVRILQIIEQMTS